MNDDNKRLAPAIKLIPQPADKAPGAFGGCRNNCPGCRCAPKPGTGAGG